MNKGKILATLGLIISLIALVVAISSRMQVHATAQEKLNVCHKTHSESNPWVTQQINANELQSHLDNGDFLYGGPLKQNGHPENANHADSLWCEGRAPEVTPPPPSGCEVDCDEAPESTPGATPDPHNNHSDVMGSTTLFTNNVCSVQPPAKAILFPFTSDAQGNRALHWGHSSDGLSKQALIYWYEDDPNTKMGADNLPANITDYTIQLTDPHRNMWAVVVSFSGECASYSDAVDK